jgi:hypothetical protein
MAQTGGYIEISLQEIDCKGVNQTEMSPSMVFMMTVMYFLVP